MMLALLLAAATISGPIQGGERGQPFGSMTAAELAQDGYVESEYFLSGTASAYQPAGAMGLDGHWAVRPSSTADFTVRLLVRRPASAGTFNGILVVEWLNVTALSEGAADFQQMREELARSGYAWVGVGAQSAGVNAPRTGLKAWDPQRYGRLVHPGDAYSYDIFTQTAAALRQAATVDALGGLRARKVIAVGRSQSAFRLVTYINAVHPQAHAYDGFFVHSRGANAAGLTADGLERESSAPLPSGAHLRADIDVPVLDLQTEGDMLALRSHVTRQEPAPNYRRWELAGAAHAESPRWVAAVPPALDFGPNCKEPVNVAPHHAVVKAALSALTRWVRDGVAPPTSPAIDLADLSATDPVVRDRFGNAKGGIRLPQLEVPTATVDGGPNVGAGPSAPGGPRNFCFLFGRTKLFDGPTLKGLYPTHDAFVNAFSRAAEALVAQGYWLKPEAEEAVRAARASEIGR